MVVNGGLCLPNLLTLWLGLLWEQLSLRLVSSPLCPTTLSFLQGFLAQGLSRTTAGLGSVIIDSQPLTVALLAALLFGETIGPLGALGLATGVLGLCLLEVSVLQRSIYLKTSHPDRCTALVVTACWPAWGARLSHLSPWAHWFLGLSSTLKLFDSDKEACMNEAVL